VSSPPVRSRSGPASSACGVGDGFEATILVEGGAPSGRVTIDANLLDHLVIEVDDGSLSVDLDGRVRNATLQLEVRLQALTQLEAGGASHVDVAGKLVGDVAVDASGASRAVIQAVELDSLALDVSGASRLEASGAATEISADVSGASEVDLAGVEASEVVVDASGASTPHVTVSELLDAVASGASTITYRGEPDRVLVDSSGASSVERA
jgi:putative autotransporter adhesin-like protein